MNLNFGSKFHVLVNLLSSMPNLEYLKLIATLPMAANGFQWQTLISEHLPMLQNFCFLIQYKACSNRSIEDQVTALVNSFNNNFWLQEHHWCVRCDWQEVQADNIYLYTLPYMSNHFYEGAPNIHLQSQITCVLHHSYNRVRSLNYAHFPNEQQTTSLPICFYNLHSLVLTLPTNDQFEIAIPSLHKLQYLELYIEKDETNDHLLTLLNTAPHLHRLVVWKWPSSTSLGLIEYITNSSIRELDLCGFSSTDSPQYFDRNRCQILSRLTLAQQCETLIIRVETRENILELLSSMKTLRLLVVKCADDPFNGPSECLSTPDK
ncbi:hypothetical protein I4U23_022777 [Adineta vaga]|nr:hypothetical protein I4U23_022777 [Adineta vaga]